MWNVSAPSLTWSVWRASTSTYPASRRRPLVPLDAKVWTRTPKSQEGRRQGRASVHRPQDAPSRLDADELIRLAEQQPNHSHYFDQAVRYTRIVAMPMSGGTLDFEELHVYSHVTTCRESFDENPSNPLSRHKTQEYGTHRSSHSLGPAPLVAHLTRTPRAVRTPPSTLLMPALAAARRIARCS